MTVPRAQTRLLVQLREFDLAVREAKEAAQRLDDRRLVQARWQHAHHQIWVVISPVAHG